MAKVGRPTEYAKEYINKVDKYLADHKDDISTKKVDLPTIEGFALFLGVNKTSLYEWEKIHPVFSNALDKIRTEQQTRLINEGLSGNYNSTIAKLILSSNHGMREKSEQDITSGNQPLQPVLVKFLNGDSKDN